MAKEAAANIEFDPQAVETALDETGVSQAELARAAGYKHRNTVNKIIKGKREATATDLLRISVALGRSPEEFARQN